MFSDILVISEDDKELFVVMYTSVVESVSLPWLWKGK